MEATLKKHLREKSENILVMYRGGGYDGCFWEWNYAYFDKDGDFHNIASSGYKGCDTEEKLIEYMDTTDKGSNIHEYDIYNLNNEADINRLDRELPISHLIGVARWLNENSNNSVTISCDNCGIWYTPDEIQGDGLHGIGGVAMEYDGKICIHCHSNHTCYHCGYFHEDTENILNDIDKCTECIDTDNLHEVKHALYTLIARL